VIKCPRLMCSRTKSLQCSFPLTMVALDDTSLGRRVPSSAPSLNDWSLCLQVSDRKVPTPGHNQTHKCNVCLSSPLQSYLTSPPAKSQSDPKRVRTHQSRMIYRSRNACVNQGTHRPKGRNIRDFSLGTHRQGRKNIAPF